MSNRPSDERDRGAASANPADRNDDESAEATREPKKESEPAGLHNAQSAQNQDQNKEYDPSQGKRSDQRRRNDKQGQMGG
jgi:hypothetical protein